MRIPIYKSGIHFGEEKIVPGNERSGMIVFTGCHLKCRFCYTPETSVHRLGEDYSAAGFDSLLYSLVERGARNINLISPTHVWPEIEASLITFGKAFPTVPIVLKISGYEPASRLGRMLPVGDVFVPDFKVLSPELAKKVQLPADYGDVAAAAVQTLVASGKPVVVRHLMMPDCFEDSRRIIQKLGELRLKKHLNLMTRFIDPHSGLRLAEQERIEALVTAATRSGISVLVDGESRGSKYVA